MIFVTDINNYGVKILLVNILSLLFFTGIDGQSFISGTVTNRNGESLSGSKAVIILILFLWISSLQTD